MSLPRTWLFCKDTNINQKNSIWHLVCTDLRRAMRGLMQRVLCAVSFSKHVSQHSFGSSHKLYKCCILKRSEKIKVKAIQYAGRRYCDWSGRHVKPQGLFGHIHVKARRKPVEMKSRDFSQGVCVQGEFKADGVSDGGQVFSLLGGCSVGLCCIP